MYTIYTTLYTVYSVHCIQRNTQCPRGMYVLIVRRLIYECISSLIAYTSRLPILYVCLRVSTCVYVCMNVHGMYGCMCMCVYDCVSVCMRMYMGVYGCVCVYVSVYGVYLCMCTWVSMRVYVCMYVCMYVCTCFCKYIYACVGMC